MFSRSVQQRQGLTKRKQGLPYLILATIATVALTFTLTTRPVESKNSSASGSGKVPHVLRAERMKHSPVSNFKSNVATFFAVITVDRTDDNAAASACTAAPNDCSLRGATIFANANPGTTINLPAGTYQLTTDGSAEVGFCLDENIGDLNIAGNNTSIIGAGAASTIIQQTTLHDRVICVDANLVGNFNFQISGVTITGGRETNGVGGGGMVSGGFGDVTTVTDCVISNNQVSGIGSPVGGGIGNGAGSLNVSGTTFSNNTSAASGGGIYHDALGAGTLSIQTSTLTNNTSTSGNGGGLLSAASGGGGPYSLTTSSFSGNHANGGTSVGGAIYAQSGSLTVTRSSLSGNQASASGGGVANGGGLTIANYNRIVGNTSAAGSGASNSGGTLDANNNWWGCNAGPGAPCNTLQGTTIVSWLQLRNLATDSTLCSGQATTLTADIKGRVGGPSLTTELVGLPAFPVPAGTIFSNAVNGTLSAASTQFLNGAATATFTVGATSPASASATADSETVGASITINSTSTTKPADQSVCQGATASFSTTPSGSGPFHFAWTVDGSPFGGDTSSISVPTGALSIGNHPVEVTVSGGCGSAVQDATLTVDSGTTTTDPVDTVACQGNTVNFSTTASGTGPFSFVWKQGPIVLVNGSLGGRVSIVNTATTSTLTINSAQPGDSGTYSVETSGSCNTATQSASLAVNAGGPTITLKNVSISLWPPNHQYRTINVTDLVASASDACDAGVTVNSVRILKVTSDEPDDNLNGADGNTVNDMLIAGDCKSVQLRAERDGNLDGRVYTITFIATDIFGNSSTVTANVSVPLSQNGNSAVDSGVHNTVNGNCP